MKNIRRIALTLAATALSLGTLAATGPAAHADTSWGCYSCRAIPK